ncbi:Thymidylate kinase [Candidatus Fokinia solitaria]|uniref:Thymidylate kinase n=1 Tax=Candidatus Fokinia solitaria TaxID=1802984 RepID=A0A2U8BSC5_9RICK|nr:dTMP kinase [Candidatus Fokinia solitaria]AWD33237.1 Thymidylate kinase [Candidatus Fokinia solitaria]
MSYFITIEGGEAVGKSTQLQLLSEKLKERNFSTYNTKEPGGTKIGEAIRRVMLSEMVSDPITEMFLLSASRRENVKVIREHLKNEKVVLCDRYIDSSVAYQITVKDGDSDIISKMIEYSTENLIPDLTIILDLEPKVAMERIALSTSHNSVYDMQTYEFHSKVRAAFLKIYEENKGKRNIVLLNSAEDINIVSDTILNEVLNLIKRNTESIEKLLINK